MFSTSTKKKIFRDYFQDESLWKKAAIIWATSKTIMFLSEVLMRRRNGMDLKKKTTRKYSNLISKCLYSDYTIILTQNSAV